MLRHIHKHVANMSERGGGVGEGGVGDVGLLWLMCMKNFHGVFDILNGKTPLYEALDSI